MNRSGKLALGLLMVWFFLALVAAARGAFVNPLHGVGVTVGIAALIPILLFFAWFGLSPSFRKFVFSLNPGTLTALQTWRIIGLVFVVLEAHRALPAVFALPAGYGDIAIGATASFVAWKFANPERRGVFILWQLLGILDLVTAVSLGTTARLISPSGPTMLLVTQLPLSLIPTFFVPLFTMIHVICIAQAKAWKAENSRTQRRGLPISGAALGAF
ncbi:MAG TPA: hypothetical protein VMJ93_03365 [Verrucomicrobiae bacterium]|nr:hypothetical protein [Verrucomicrobiae bacterium]